MFFSLISNAESHIRGGVEIIPACYRVARSAGAVVTLDIPPGVPTRTTSNIQHRFALFQVKQSIGYRIRYVGIVLVSVRSKILVPWSGDAVPYVVRLLIQLRVVQPNNLFGHIKLLSCAGNFSRHCVRS